MRVSIVNQNLVAEDAIGQCLLNQLRFFRRRGDEVRLYLMNPPQRIEQDVVALTRVVSLSDLISRDISDFTKSDLYVYHYPGWYPLMESIKGLDRGAVIFYYHNVTPPALWGSDFERDRLQRSVESVGSLAYYADSIVTPSDYNAERLVEEHGCERDRIRVLPLAVPLDKYAPGPPDPALVRQYGLEGRQVILFVGRMAGNKRIDLLVQALAEVRRSLSNAVLVLVGDDRSNPALEETVAGARERASELGVSDQVIFTGRIPDILPFYRLADVYATASLHEGFGVPLIEAMASGVPVVASRATAHPWVLGDAGLLAEPGNATDLAEKISRILTDDDLCGELVQRGLARAREFSLETYEAGWSQVVAEAAAWLPSQPYPRPRSVLARSASALPKQREGRSTTMSDVEFVRSEVDQLETAADVMIRGYTVRSRIPVLGPIVSWFRRNVTSHLREPYIDPMFERQVRFNRRVVAILRDLVERLDQNNGGMVRQADLSDREKHQTEGQFARLEGWLGLLSAQLALLAAEQSADHRDQQIVQIREQIEALRTQLAADSSVEQG
jgi:glycosyltransferase involved in cell wall biosynthesis